MCASCDLVTIARSRDSDVVKFIGRIVIRRSNFQKANRIASSHNTLLDVSNIDNFSIIHDLNLLKNEMKATKKESESTKKLSDQLAEV